MGFQESHGRGKNTSAAEGGRKILAFFFFGAKLRFQWENVEFWSILEFHGCKICYIFSFDGRNFWRNEISTDVRFRDSLGSNREEGETKSYA